MWDDATSGFGGELHRGDDGLLRQAFLLTGDAARAERLADRAASAAASHVRRAGPAGSEDVARAELVRAFVTDSGPGGHAGGPLPAGRHAAAWAALGNLPARRRAVIVLRYDEGLSEEQIAARMGSAARTVRADIEAGLLTLRTALNGAPDPGQLVSAALAEAGSGRWGTVGVERTPPPDSRSWAAEWQPAPAPHQDGRFTGAPPHPAPAAEGWRPDAPALPHRTAAAHQGLAPGAAAAAAGAAGWAARAEEARAWAAAGSTGPGTARAGHRDAPSPETGAPADGARSAVPRPDPARPRPGQARPQPEPARAHAGPARPEPGTGRPGPGVDRPAGAEPPSFPAATFPLDRPAPARRSLRTPAAIAAAGVTALVLGVVAVGLPAVLGDDPASPPAAADTSAASQAAPVVQVPTRSVPEGLLDWPARGPQGGDEKVLAAATAAWQARVPAAEAPAEAAGLLYAGAIDGRQVALVQALDRSGAPRLAQLTGSGTESLRLVRAEKLAGDADVLSVLPAAGPSGPIRVLVSPEGQAADGLRSSDPMSGKPLAKIRLDRDGISDVLPSPPGVPTCSRVVVLGLPAPLGRTGSRVLQSGVVFANQLAAKPMDVEVGSSTLAAGADTEPETLWFDDGARLAKKAGGGMVVVAGLGPRLAPAALSDDDRRRVHSRAYELRRGKQTFVGSVVSLDGKIVCTTVTPVGPRQQSPLSAFALRCPLPGGSGTMGLLHVVGGADVQSVEVQLAPTRQPAGQLPYGSSIARPQEAPASGFAVLDVVESGFPCGGGTVQASGGSGTAAPLVLPVFRP